MKKNIIFTIILLILPLAVFAFELPAGKAWTTQTISVLLDNIAKFLIWAGIAGATITIVYAGILYFTSGFNPKAVENAKGILKNAIIGIALVVGFGVIINTVAAVITGNFFGGGNDNNNGNLPVENQTLIAPGQLCSSNTDVCNRGDGSCIRDIPSGKLICVRTSRNLTGEGCYAKNHCADGLDCVRQECLSAN